MRLSGVAVFLLHFQNITDPSRFIYFLVYDAGAQILFNALDWLLPPGIVEPVTPPRVGKMANPILGMVMLLLVTIGLVFSDGFLGFSYLASLFVKGVMPHNLHDEAFSALHKKIGQHASVAGSPPESSSGQRQLASTRGKNARVKNNVRSGNVDVEIADLLGSIGGDMEISSQPSI